MVFIDFSLTDKTFYDAKRDWEEAGKTPEEISILTTELLGKRAAEVLQRQNNGAGGITKFPKWLRSFLTDWFAPLKGKLRHDSENDIFKLAIGMDLLDVDDMLNKLSESYSALLSSNQEYGEFALRYQLHPMVTDDDENIAMADLENHARGAKKDDHDSHREESEEEEPDAGTSGADGIIDEEEETS